MKIFLVGTRSCDGSDVEYVCLSKERSLERWEEIRQELIFKAKEDLEQERERKSESGMQIYERILKNLSEVDLDLMENYPHDEPYICEMEIDR